MKDNKEKQISTEQYYGSIEGNNIPAVEEEQSYTLEDLHPEEQKKEKKVTTVKSLEEEVQPDPTVIEGVKASIGNSSAMNETPKPTNNFNQNHLELIPKPVVSNIPKQEPVPVSNNVVNNHQIRVQNTKPQDQSIVPNAKVFYLVFGVILLFLIVGLPLFSTMNNSLNSSTGVSEPIKKETENDKEPATLDVPESQAITPTSSQPIAFDMNLSFDKGWVANEKEVNQRQGFLPTNLTGVIRCDLEQPVVNEGITTYSTTYLYYENYKLVSAIDVKKQKYSSPTLYTEGKNTAIKYKIAGDKNDSLDVKTIQSDQSYTITNIMKYNLQYGISTYVEELNENLLFPLEYETNIKTSIERTIATGSNNGGAICGSIITSDTGN